VLRRGATSPQRPSLTAPLRRSSWAATRFGPVTASAPDPRRPLDAASSEPLHPRAREVLLAALDQGWADPRRLHHEGRRARMLLDNAREVVAEGLGLRPDEVTFTSSGTDAVHRGLLGLQTGRRRAGRAVAHSAVGPASVLHAARWSGAPLVAVPV